MQSSQRMAASMSVSGALMLEIRGGRIRRFSGGLVRRLGYDHASADKSWQESAVQRDSQALESAATYEMLVTGGVHDENETDAAGEAYDLASLTRQEKEHAQEQASEAGCDHGPDRECRHQT